MGSEKSSQELYYEVLLLKELLNSEYINNNDREEYIGRIQQISKIENERILKENNQQKVVRDAVSQEEYNRNVIDQLVELGVDPNVEQSTVDPINNIKLY